MPEPDLLIDITRTVSRAAHQSYSGVDRVERAYIDYALQRPGRAFFLTRVLAGYAIFDQGGMASFLEQVKNGQVLGRVDLTGRFSRQSKDLKRVETAVRGMTPHAKGSRGLKTLLKDRLKQGFIYLNVGHTNLRQTTLETIRSAGAAKIATLIHDIIPLRYPEFSRPGTPENFAKRLRVAVQNSDLLIYNSRDTQKQTENWLSENGFGVNGIAAPLGVNSPATAIATEYRKHPSFVVLGTIEPRKNHLLLLNIWRQFHETLPEQEIPHLHIVGRRGWENENVLDMLERANFIGKTVFEHGYLDDAEMFELVAKSRALLFPTFAEGYGLPLAEALLLNKRVICSDLPVFKEISEHPIYLNPLDGPGWKDQILSMAREGMKQTSDAKTKFNAPSWDRHFEIVEASLLN